MKMDYFFSNHYFLAAMLFFVLTLSCEASTKASGNVSAKVVLEDLISIYGEQALVSIESEKIKSNNGETLYFNSDFVDYQFRSAPNSTVNIDYSSSSKNIALDVLNFSSIGDDTNQKSAVVSVVNSEDKEKSTNEQTALLFNQDGNADFKLKINFFNNRVDLVEVCNTVYYLTINY